MIKFPNNTTHGRCLTSCRAAAAATARRHTRRDSITSDQASRGTMVTAGKDLCPVCKVR